MGGMASLGPAEKNPGCEGDAKRTEGGNRASGGRRRGAHGRGTGGGGVHVVYIPGADAFRNFQPTEIKTGRGEALHRGRTSTATARLPITNPNKLVDSP